MPPSRRPSSKPVVGSASERAIRKRPSTRLRANAALQAWRSGQPTPEPEVRQSADLAPSQPKPLPLPGGVEQAADEAVLKAAAAYNPESPWGVLGPLYDPVSPFFAWKPSSTSDGRPAKDTTAPVARSSDTTSLPPQPGDKAAPFSEGLQKILRIMASAAKAKSELVAESECPEFDGRFVQKRFVLADCPAHEGGRPKTACVASHRNAADAATTNWVTSPKTAKKSSAGRIRTPATSPATVAKSLIARIPRCCPVEVPSILHMILDKTGDKLDPRMIDQYSGLVGQLCPAHLEKYNRLKAAMRLRDTPSSSPAPPHHPSTPMAASPAPLPVQGTLPVLHPKSPSTPAPTPPTKRTYKKRRVPGDPNRAPRVPKAVRRSDIRPVANAIRDSSYRNQFLQEMQAYFDRPRPVNYELTHGDVTNRLVYKLLSVARQPNVAADKGPVDAHFLTGEDAYAVLERGSPGEPIVTDKEQTFRWQPWLRPIDELFRRMENLDRLVSVQVPSRSCMEDSFESHHLGQVRARFLGRKDEDGGGDGRMGTATTTTTTTTTAAAPEDDPWNILDLRSPLPAAVLPQFLTCENCQLLPRLRDEVLSPSRAERDTATREQWNEWRNILEWVLLSQGGHNTSPHTDSHGLATWITVQEGLFGFGWMSQPTAEERAQWMADPQGFTGGQWCYLVLEPGQTVFFNSGTVHFVFRLRSEPTLALGGHILQWTGIEQWLRIVAAQMANPHITNEDMEWSAPKYVRVVARLVETRLRSGRVEELGGAEAVQRLLALLKEFDDLHIKGRPQRKGSKKRKHR